MARNIRSLYLIIHMRASERAVGLQSRAAPLCFALVLVALPSQNAGVEVFASGLSACSLERGNAEAHTCGTEGNIMFMQTRAKESETTQSKKRNQQD